MNSNLRKTRRSGLSSHSLELLENRKHLSVARDNAGWTSVTPATDTRVIYVSNSQGSDSNNGLSTQAPLKSLSKAQSLVRDGGADWVLLKRGDTFEGFGTWKKAGRSAQEPLYISAYGTGDRPQINSGASSAFVTSASGSHRTSYLVVSSLSFSANTYNGSNGAPSGFRLLSPGNNITIEDCKVAGFKDGFTIGDPSHPITDSTIRRCVIVDSYSTSNPDSSHAQGIYVSNSTVNLTIEENILDHNGWRQNTPSDRTFFNHNIYVYNDATNTVVRNNIIADASFYGIKFNSGGTASGNLMLRNSESVYLEGAATIENNVISEAVDMPSQSWGVGINTQKAPSATIRHNLITKAASKGATQLIGISLYNNKGSFSGMVEQNVIYNWKNTGISVSTNGNGPGSVVIRNNQVQMVSGDTAISHSSGASKSTFVYSGNTYSSAQSNANKIAGSKKSLSQWISTMGESDAKYQTLAYPDATRDIERYSTTAGGAGTFDSFIASARGMDRMNWNPAYTAANANAWMWKGFEKSDIVPTVLSQALNSTPLSATLDVKFSQDIGAPLATSGLTVQNTSNGQVIPFVLTSYDAITSTGHYSYAGTLAPGYLNVSLNPAAPIIPTLPPPGPLSFPALIQRTIFSDRPVKDFAAEFLV